MQNEELPLVEVGRMIAALRSRWTWRGSRWYRRKDKRRWTDEQIRDALHLSPQHFKRATKAYYDQVTSPKWSQELIAERLLKFGKKHKRWPTNSELRHEWRKHDLCCDSSMRTWFNTGTVTINGRWHWLTVTDQAQRYIVDEPKLRKKLTPALILGIRNVTIRRDAMEHYGVEKLQNDGGGEQIQQDDFGTLWRMPSDNDQEEHMQYVEVVNSTPEPDGSHTHYFLRVPPHINTAKEAVAWTFQLDEDEELKFVVQT
jgi:hypothetical protein